MRELLHPEAMFESALMGGRAAPARTVLTAAALADWRRYETTAETFQLIGRETVLVTGHNRIDDEVSPAAWLITHRDDLIYRSRIFSSADDARAAAADAGNGGSAFQ